MEIIFIAFFINGIISLLLYTKPSMGAKIGFSLSAIISLASAFYFLLTIHEIKTFTLIGNFLSSPKFLATPLESFFCFIVCFIGFSGAFFGINYSKIYASKSNISIFASLYSFFILSMLLVITSDNIFSFLLLWEVMTLLSALLIMINDGKNATHTIMVYLGVAQVGAFCLVGALVIMGQASGSFIFADFANINISPLLSALCFLLLFIGFGSKAGLWPFHFWLKNAYALAPSNVSALMSGVMIKVGIFAFIKFSIFLPISPSLTYVILFIGGISVVVGALYAAVENNSKSAIAYSSCENAGIIFLGIGAGLYGTISQLPLMASFGFIAAFFHILNHATFKSLLFLGCGSVYANSKSDNMNLMGGYAKKMPKTALFFLIGTIAITALPPLNGFASEWVTYKSLLLGGANEAIGARFFFIFAILFLAAGGTVALFAFVKIYGSIFSGQPKNKKMYESMKENSIYMVLPLMILALSCVGFGLGASYVTSFIASILSHKIPIISTFHSDSLVSLPLLTLIFLLAITIGFIGLLLFRADFSKARVTEPWASGYKYDANMQIGSNSFSGDLRKILSFFYRQKPKVIEQDGYFGKVTYKNEIKDIWWSWVDKLIVGNICKIAHKIGIFQSGQTNLYAGYILIYMCIMFIFSYYFLGDL